MKKNKILRKWRERTPYDPAEEKSLDFIYIKPKHYNQEPFLAVKKGSEVLPQWYKDLPPKAFFKDKEDLTLKKCVPFLDSMMTGYYLVTTRDYEFSANEDGTYSFKGESFETGYGPGNFAIQMHSIEQVGGMPIPEEYSKYLFKWNSPFLIKTPPGHSIIFTHPLNFVDLPFYTLSGQVDTDEFPLSVLFPFIMKNKQSFIPKGTPIVQIIPFKREDWKLNQYNDPSDDFISDQYFITKNYLENMVVDDIPTGGIYLKKFRQKKYYR